MQTVRNLVHMCIDSSQQMIGILDVLLEEGLLGERGLKRVPEFEADIHLTSDFCAL